MKYQDAFRNYQSNEQGLIELLQQLEYVQGTFPPVYKLGSTLIGYDKLDKITIIASNNQKSKVDSSALPTFA